MEREVVVLLGVDHLEPEPFANDQARIADLAARLAVEGRGVEDQGDRRTFAARRSRLGELALFEDPDDRALRAGGFVTCEEVRPL
jgi:hypothetical protein